MRRRHRLLTAVALVATVCTAAPGRSAAPAGDVQVNDPKATYGGAQLGVREPVVAVSPRNPRVLIAAAIDNNPRNEMAENASWEGWVHAYRSADGGTTWRSSRLFGFDPSFSQATGDPALAFAPDGTAYLAVLSDDLKTAHHRRIEVYRSTDGGATWQGPTFAFQGHLDPAEQDCASADKELLAVDPRTGELLITYTGTTWRCGDPVNDALVDSIGTVPPDAAMNVFLVRSRDRGRTWTAPQTVFAGYALGATPVVGNDGSLHVILTGAALLGTAGVCPSALGVVASYRPAEMEMVVASSYDDGRSWTYERRPVCEGEVLAGERASLTGGATLTGGAMMPSLTVDRSTGRLYAAWPAFAGNLPALTFGVEVMSSSDSGRTWTATAHATSPAGDAVLSNVSAYAGVVRLVWTGTDDEWETYDTFLAASSDGGATWSAPERLSSASGSGSADIGDYNWVDTAAGRMAAIWSQARDGAEPGVFVRVVRVR